MSGDWPTDPMKVLEARDRLRVGEVNGDAWAYADRHMPKESETRWGPKLIRGMRCVLDIAIVHSDAKAHDLLHRVKELEARIESLEKDRDETRP